MIIMLRTNACIVGVFEHPIDAGRYLEHLPEEPLEITVSWLRLRYPFFALEQPHNVFYFAQAREELINLAANAILYTFNGDYVPAEPFADHMGELPHEHFDTEDSDEEKIMSGRASANLPSVLTKDVPGG